MDVPFLDLGAQCSSIRGELEDALSKVMDRTAFAGGPFVTQFEEAFADFCGTRHAVGANSGTTALWLTLLALDIGDGDEVITTPHTFIATAAAVSYTGATPVFVDVEEGTLNMDPDGLEAAITPRTRGIIPVHLYGQSADMDPILEIARAHDLTVIEDAAQAHGAQYRGRGVGTLGRAGCFSFYPGKNLGAFGEAGAVVTDDRDLARRVRMLRDHGQETKNVHQLLGWNGRMDGFQAAVLSVKLRHLSDWTGARREIAAFYDEALGDVPGLQLPTVAPDRTHVYHLYVVQSDHRDELMEELEARGVHCGIHYPTPAHLQPAYAHLGLEPGTFPVAEEAATRVLSLPIYPEMSREEMEHVAESVRACVEPAAGAARGA